MEEIAIFKYNKKVFSDPFTIIKFLLNCKQKTRNEETQKREEKATPASETQKVVKLYFFLLPNKPSGRNFSS